MQLLNTEVFPTLAPTGEPILRVTFHGEGGECVTVDMTYAETENEEATLARARAILVQTAAFGLAANDYDAKSNGNFDEVAISSAGDRNGCVYVFEYRDGEGSRQVLSSEIPSFAAAREEAVRGAIDLLMDLQPGIDDLTGWLVRLRNEAGDVLCVIDVQEAQRARQAAQ